MTQIKNSLNHLPALYIAQFAVYFLFFLLQTIASPNAYLQKSIIANFTVTQVIFIILHNKQQPHSATHTLTYTIITEIRKLFIHIHTHTKTQTAKRTPCPQSETPKPTLSSERRKRTITAAKMQ